jgi:thymidylate kinase
LKRFLFSIDSRIFKKIKNLFHFSGEFIVILGPDGVGKSTTAEISNRILKLLNIPSYHSHLGFRPTILPRRQKIGFGEPKKNKKYIIRNFFRYCYHFFDYWLGYWFNIYPRLLRGEIVIIERYFYDYIIHPVKKDTFLNKKFINWTFRFFMPKPTACVLFTNDSIEILKRRQELTEEEIENIIREGRKLGKMAKKFIEIKTDKSPEKIAVKMVEWIIRNNSHFNN